MTPCTSNMMCANHDIDDPSLKVEMTSDARLYPTGEMKYIETEESNGIVNDVLLPCFKRKDIDMSVSVSIINQSTITYIDKVWVEELFQSIDCWKIITPGGKTYWVVRADWGTTECVIKSNYDNRCIYENDPMVAVKEMLKN